MAINKHFIHFLLVFCIGLQPALSAIAASADHSASAPMHGLDCDPAGTGADHGCADTDCDSITHSCSSQPGASFLPVSSLAEDIPIARKNALNLSDPDYRQNLTDPIYRPPIA